MPSLDEIDSRLFPSDRTPRTAKAVHVPPGTQHGAALDVHVADADRMEFTETAGLHVVRIPKYSARLTFDRLIDQRGGVTAELTVVLDATELLSGVDLGIKSDTGHTKIAGSLKLLAPTVPWKYLLQKACALVLRRHREGPPIAILSKDTKVEPLTFSIAPIVHRKKPVILYADGGKGKSTLALMWCMLVSTGERVAAFSALKGVPMYLDWEDDEGVHARRLKAIQAGHPELLQAKVLYQRCTEPLTRLIHDLARTVQAHGVTMVVIDSILQAAGGDASAEATGKLFAAIRALNVESILIGHVAKSLGEGPEHATVYGSIFNQNLSRGTWELKTQQEVGEDGAILGLFNNKQNLMRKHPPIGLKVTHNQEGTMVKYEDFDLSQAVELAAALPLPNRIRNLLEDGAARTSRQIAEELEAKLPTVKSALSRQAGFKWMMLGGSGQETQWTVLRPK